jgi:hypothetical protein
LPLHRVDEICAIADRRGFGFARWNDLAHHADAIGGEERDEARQIW